MYCYCYDIKQTFNSSENSLFTNNFNDVVSAVV